MQVLAVTSRSAMPGKAKRSAAGSVAQDVVHPPSAVRRRGRAEGERGTSHDRSQRPARTAREPVEVSTGMGRTRTAGRAVNTRRLTK